ncbi:NADH:flavin oxidoreductase [Hungatella hathewayi]
MNSIKDKLIIPNLELKNRLIMPPMAKSLCDEEGHVTPELLEYYDEKSKGGYFSMIITEHSYISKEGMANPGQMSISKDSDVEGLKRLTKVIHGNGSKVIAQISHAGSASKREVTGYPSVAPSKVSIGKRREADSILSGKDIQILIEKFVLAAKRAVQAGFDGIELHSAHGYLLNQFYSPMANKRKDAYGGNLDGRIRFHLELIQEIRNEIGLSVPLLLRLGSMDYCEGGNRLQDAIAAAVKFEKKGIDILDISGGMNGYIIREPKNELGYYTDITEVLKKKICIPVIMTGGVTDLRTANRIIEEKKADLVGVGRAVLKDSLWAEKEFHKYYENAEN